MPPEPDDTVPANAAILWWWATLFGRSTSRSLSKTAKSLMLLTAKNF
jgi:hypothetical protein